MAGKPPEALWEQFSQDTQVLTTWELVEKYDKAPSTIREWRIFLQRQGIPVGYGHGVHNGTLQPLYYVPVLDKYERIQGDAIVTGDFHFPFCNWEYVNRVVPVAEKFGIKRLIIAGDLMDMQSLSFFPKDTVPVKWEQELEETERVIDYYCDAFDEIIDTVGNHLRNRALRRLEGQLDVGRFKRLFSKDARVKCSPYPFLKLSTARGTYHITHQKNYRKNPLSVARDLCHKHRSHVITHHQHRMAFGFDESGHYMLIDNGSMADEDKMDWVQMQDTTANASTHGFVAIKGGYPYLLGQHTDWEGKLWEPK